MTNEPIFKLSPEAFSICKILLYTLHAVESSADTYLERGFLENIGVECDALDLEGTDTYFKALTKMASAKLQPSEPTEPFADPTWPEDPPPIYVIH